MKGAKSIIKIKSCNEFEHMLLMCTHRYLKSVLRYNFSILGTYHPDTPHLPCIYARIREYISKAKGVREQRIWETLT